MKEIQYKDFSLKTHKKNWRINKPNVCQFELTFSCDFHCLYCYSDCYNNPEDIKRELSTNQVKAILDKVYQAGCLWLCFTGGDPLKREDFLEIYSYAKEKGFIITIFTNAYSLTKTIADFLKDKPPFVVELTINAVTKKTFEEISQIPDSYERTFENLNMLIERKILLKIKTMLIKNNLAELAKIEKFFKNLGLEFFPSPFINARLNKDITPCSLRVAPEEVFSNNERRNQDFINKKEDKNCFYNRVENTQNQKQGTRLFRCNAGSRDGINIDPYGKMFFCCFMREPSIDLLKQDIQEALFGLFPQVAKNNFDKDSVCRSCQIRYLCYSCPGRAFLEKGDIESPIEWFCQSAHLVTGKINSL